MLGIGRAAKWSARKGINTAGHLINAGVRVGTPFARNSGLGKVAAGTLFAGAATVGVLGYATDPNKGFGPVWESLYGDANLPRAAISGAAIDAITDDPRRDSHNPMNYYYGQPYNANARMRSNAPMVDGSIVFGMNNMRRGR